MCTQRHPLLCPGLEDSPVWYMSWITFYLCIRVLKGVVHLCPDLDNKNYRLRSRAVVGSKRGFDSDYLCSPLLFTLVPQLCHLENGRNNDSCRGLQWTHPHHSCLSGAFYVDIIKSKIVFSFSLNSLVLSFLKNAERRNEFMKERTFPVAEDLKLCP